MDYYTKLNYFKIFKMKKKYTALGMMSGTSFDGIDLSIIETDGNEFITLKRDFYKPYGQKIKDQLEELKQKFNQLNASSLINSDLYKKLNRIITILHIEAATQLIKSYNKKIDIVGFHGVTVFHNSKKKISIQLGDPLLLRQSLQASVVFNFRKNDIMNGGEGAPLVPIYHKLLFKKFKERYPCLFLNIGGISNFTYVNKSKIYASDIGPGNCLLDKWIKINTNKNFDKDGKIALKGTVNFNYVNNFLDRFDYFNKKNISYDTSDFNISELRGFSTYDGAATLSYISGILIVKTIEKFKKIKKVFVSGGGRKNLFLMRIIKNNTKVDIINFDKKKIDGDFVESQAFAYIAVRSLLKKTISFPQTTGVCKSISGGDIYKI